MDILQQRVWRTCGWAAGAMFAGVITLGAYIAATPQTPDVCYPAINLMICAWAILTVIRVFAPHLAKTRQEHELNLSLQRRVLARIDDAPPELRLVAAPAERQDVRAATPMPRHRRTRAAAGR